MANAPRKTSSKLDEHSVLWMRLQLSVILGEISSERSSMGKSFGKILEELIKHHNMSISQFAKKIGVSPKTAQEWVGSRGRFPNSPKIIKNIANEFNISVHELLYGEPDPTSLIGAILEKTEIHTGLYEINIRKVKVKK